MTRNVLLMILDGWGIGDGSKSDAIRAGHPVFIEELTRSNPHAALRTDGENVGLPEGQMGNSEVGHLNIGAGRVVYQISSRSTVPAVRRIRKTILWLRTRKYAHSSIM